MRLDDDGHSKTPAARAEREIIPGDASTSERISDEDSARKIQEHDRGHQPKTSATTDQLDRAFTLLTGSLAQHGDDLYRAGLATCLRALADHVPGTFVAMAEMVSELFAEQPQSLPLLAERLHNLGSAEFVRESPVSPAFAAEMHEHYYDALFGAARVALRPLREARRDAKRAAKEGPALQRMAIDDTIANQAADILIREVERRSARPPTEITAPVVFFRALPANASRAFARAALFANPTRPTWGDKRVGRAADVAAMVLSLAFGKGEITKPESWRDKVKDGRKLPAAQEGAPQNSGV